MSVLLADKSALEWARRDKRARAENAPAEIADRAAALNIVNLREWTAKRLIDPE